MKSTIIVQATKRKSNPNFYECYIKHINLNRIREHHLFKQETIVIDRDFTCHEYSNITNTLILTNKKVNDIPFYVHKDNINQFIEMIININFGIKITRMENRQYYYINELGIQPKIDIGSGEDDYNFKHGNYFEHNKIVLLYKEYIYDKINIKKIKKHLTNNLEYDII